MHVIPHFVDYIIVLAALVAAHGYVFWRFDKQDKRIAEQRHAGERLNQVLGQ